MNSFAYNIFYTDDDQDDHELFSEVIDSMKGNFNIYPQYNGQELLNQLKMPPPKPDLIFLDLNMPKKNGFEVLKEMKNDENLNNIPVVVFSTSVDEKIIKTCKDLGADLYITKPDSYPHLKKVLGNVLSMDWKNPPTAENFVLKAS